MISQGTKREEAGHLLAISWDVSGRDDSRGYSTVSQILSEVSSER